MTKKTLFLESLENHQKLIDILLECQNQEGICVISEKQLSIAMDRSLTWVQKAINQINREDLCVEFVGRDRYIVHYDDLIKRGVFNVVFRMMIDTFENIEILGWTNAQLMDCYGCKLQTVQMYRAYCTTGWIKGLNEFPAVERIGAHVRTTVETDK